MYTLYNFLTQVPTSLKEQMNKDHYEKKKLKTHLFLRLLVCYTYFYYIFPHFLTDYEAVCRAIYTRC